MPDLLKSLLMDDTPSQAIDLIDSLLSLEPESRITAKQALLHPFFAEITQQTN